MRNRGEISADEWQLLLVANTVKDDSRNPQPEATKAWLDNKVRYLSDPFTHVVERGWLCNDSCERCVMVCS